MKLAHTGDMHMGCRQYGIQRRETDFYDAVDKMADAVLKCADVSVLIIAGDAFDAVKPPAEAVKRLQNTVSRLKDGNITVVGIEGNHDKAGNGQWLSVTGIVGLSTVPVVINGLSFCGIDYCRATDIIETLDAMIAQNVKCDVLVVHTGFAEMGDSFSSEMSAWSIVPKLKELGVKYVANGHIHKKSTQVFDGIRFLQPGSTEMKSMDEDQDKSCTVVGTETWNVSELPFNTRTFRNYTITAEEELEKFLGSEANQQWFYTVYVKNDIQNGAERIAKHFGDSVMHRIVPFGDTTGKTLENIDRSSGISTISDAITVFFNENSEEASLVKEILNNPENIRNITTKYMETKHD